MYIVLGPLFLLVVYAATLLRAGPTARERRLRIVFLVSLVVCTVYMVRG